jgi:hypothetical protein
MRRRRRLTPLALLLLLATPCRADDNGAGSLFGPRPDGQPGNATLTFTDPSPLANSREIGNRLGKLYDPDEAARVAYKLPDESFEVYAPRDYTGEKPFGLFVFISPSGNGKPPRHWLDSMDQHHLIWCGPNKAGNDRYAHLRMGLAIDAVHNMRQKYNIDPNRVYVAGVSGGGRIASMLGVCFSDVFNGGYYIIGCNFYIQEKSVEQNGVFRRAYNLPPAKYLVAAKKQSKHVFLTGDTDGNRDQTQIYYNAFKREGFEHITYFQVPGMGHQAPDPEWFEKGMKALDEPLPPPGTPRPPTTRRALAATTRPVAATQATTQPAAANDPAAVARQLLTRARLYLDNKQYELAREKLRWIATNYPTTPAAAEARTLLRQIEGK